MARLRLLNQHGRQRRHCGTACPRRPVRGAALLVALVLLTVISTLASGMVWQQWRAVQIEAAERGRVQSGWMLYGALDYARLILREDARIGNPTNLSDPWATPLEETKVSTMLAVDRDNNADTDLQAFISGAIADSQSRYNLRNLVAEGKLVKAQVEVLARLCASVSLPTDVATRLAERLQVALAGTDDNAPLVPQNVDDLGWLGIDAATRQRLAPLVTLLPEPTPLNINTASREVLAAVIPNIDLGSADRLVAARLRKPFKSVDEVSALLGANLPLPAGLVDVRSAYFDVVGRMRLEDRVLAERFTIQRRQGLDIRTIARQRSANVAGNSKDATPAR